jgi:hypothetical protein
MAGKGKTKPLEYVRSLYESKGFDALWQWGAAGEGAQEKAHRFRILEIFAERRRDSADNDKDKERWASVRVIYAKERDKWTEKARQNAESREFNDSLGDPHWGGSRDFFDAKIYPLALKMGMQPDYDDKEEGHAVGGDHDPNVLNAFAEDFPTFDGAAFANALAKSLGKASGSVGTYDFIYYKWQNITWRVQILWAVPDHYNHVHVGARPA